MSASTPNSAPYVAIETVAWYWLWSGALCLLLVPAAWAWSTTWGWLPYWLVGAPLALVAGVRVLAWSQDADVPAARNRIDVGTAVSTAGRKLVPVVRSARSKRAGRRRALLAALLSR